MTDKHDKHHKDRHKSKHDKHDKMHAHTEYQRPGAADPRTSHGEGRARPGYPGAETHGAGMHGVDATRATRDRFSTNTSTSTHEYPSTHNPMNKVHPSHLNSVKNKRDSGWRHMENAGKQQRGRG